MRIVTIVGARPQLIKAAGVSSVLRNVYEEILIHTGQHYNQNMSDIFFEELGLPRPDINLGIGSGLQGQQTGRMLEKLEQVLITNTPDMVLVYGDTNSTLAGALAASKLHIPVVHVEAGLRSFNKHMPEEQNRILTDHLSSWLFTPTATASDNLKKEGIVEGVHQVGDVMYDGILMFKKRVSSGALERLGVSTPFILATIHRAENTDVFSRLSSIIVGLGACGRQVVLPLHPRTKKFINQYDIEIPRNIQVIEPVGYLDMLALMDGADKIVTDSGGVQKEAYFLAKPCITTREQTEWVETCEEGWNVLTGADSELIIRAIQDFNPAGVPKPIFGDGHAALHIVEQLASFSKTVS